MIGESDRAGLNIGFKQVRRALSEKRALKVFLSRDCDEKMQVSVECECKSNDVPLFYVDTMTELGNLCGIDVRASCAVVTK